MITPFAHMTPIGRRRRFVAVDTLMNGLVGWWKFDEGSGTTAADSSGNGNDGIITAGTFVSGRIGSSAISLNGSTSLVVKASGIVQSPPFSVSVWIKGNTQGVALSILSSASGNWDGWYMGPGYLVAVNNNDFSATDASNSDVDSAVWKHFCFVVASSVGRDVYVNGVIGTTGTISSTPSFGSYRFTLGCSYRQTVQDNFADGLYDDVRVYNRVLTPTEIAALAAM